MTVFTQDGNENLIVIVALSSFSLLRPQLSHLLSHASRASTFHDFPQMQSLLTGYILNRGGNGGNVSRISGEACPKKKNTLEKVDLWAPH